MLGRETERAREVETEKAYAEKFFLLYLTICFVG